MFLPTLALAYQLPPIQPFVAQIRAAIGNSNQVQLTKLFMQPSTTDFLFRMAQGRGGLRNLKVAVIPAPPGWTASGKYWAVFHTRQDIEDYHDTVYPVVVTGEEWKLGPEIPEDATIGVQVKDAALDVHVLPSSSSVQVHATLSLAVSGVKRAPLFRLNDNYRVSAAMGAQNCIEVGDSIPTPREGDIVHAGGLLIPWTIKIPAQAEFDYTGTLTSRTEDKIDGKTCYVTAWWVPTLARMPFTTTTHVVGPADWVLQSEGKRIDAEDGKLKPVFKPKEGEQECFFRCDIPISYPKVVGGKYIVAAEKRAGNRTFRAYHLNSSDLARAQRNVQTIADAVAWYEDHLGPFPFAEYNCYDSDTYYGIESYNYTLLLSTITDWAVAHEVGHTYFGGLVPCSYVHDSWNESMTQYVDSVLRQNNADQTLDAAIRPQSLSVNVPLTQMPVAHEYDSLTYSRGAYVLRMLENEIGTDNMYKALRSLIAERVGKDTTWYDLRPYFEKAGGKKLDWFWSQWVSGSKFPTLQVIDAQGIPTPSGTRVLVTVRQSGTPTPFRLKVKVVAKGLNKEVSQVFDMRSPEATFELNLGGAKAYEAVVDTFGYVLAPRPPAARVKV